MMDLKELEKFLKICRKQGVTEINWNGMSVKLGDLPARKNAQEDDTVEESEELTPDEMIFYATRGGPQ